MDGDRLSEDPLRPEEIVSILDGSGEGIYVNTDQSLYCCRPADGAEHLLDWDDFFLRGRDVLQVCAGGEGFQLLLRKNGSLRQVEIGRAAPGESGKQKVTIGVLTYKKSHVAELVEAFNAASPGYEIEMIEYDYSPTDGSDEIYLQLLKGEGPDMFELSGLGLPEDVLAGKGVLEDLTPYLEESDVVKVEDILPCVTEAGSHQGRLVSLCPLFNISALAVERGHTRDGGWTPEDFLAYAAEHPDSALYQKGTSRRGLLEDLLAGDMGEYIDWGKRECCFDSERFISLLEAVRQADISSAALEEEKGREGFFAGKYLVVEYKIVSAEDYADAVECLEGYGEIAGYPVSSGEPYFLMEPVYSFGINSGSGCREGAWAFLEYVMSVDFLNWEGERSHCWPARIEAFEDNLRILGHVPESGIYGRRVQGFSGEVLENAPVPEITEEIKDSLRFIAGHMHYDSRNVWTAGYKEIILEEAEAYFAGDKTAREAAELIQNRVSLFLSE